ncbi:MAG: cytochrome c [Rhodospirillales bacterium]|nr:cytochrome c [Rhodospirillales bacterium]
MAMTDHRLIAALTVFLAIAAATSVSGAAERLDPQSIKLPQMTPELNVGKLNYDAKCAACHGLNTAGTDQGPTFLHRVYHPGHHGDRAFYLAPKNGARAHHWRFGDMPPVAGITDSQIEKIIGYVRAVQAANGLF